MSILLWLAIVCLIIALIAYFLGAGAAGATALLIAKWSFVAFIILLVVGILLSLVGGPGPFYPGRAYPY
jgi:uncharacterized membrane protein YtjA (UPF0391 family)